jgi:hypothetical protein
MLFATALALLVTTAASAQSIKVKANIPFGFVVNRATLPAGEYTLESVDLDGRVLAIRDVNAKGTRLVMSLPCQKLDTASQTSLVFHRYGNRYFLKRIWVQGNNAGHELQTGPREREVAKDFSMQEVVLMAARR